VVDREARRIAETLRMPGQPAEQLLEVMSFRRSDGSEVSLSRLPIEQVVRSGETMRAEEVVLSVPDGRSVRVPVNATPIRTEGDAIGSVVVTCSTPGASRRARSRSIRSPRRWRRS